MLVPSLFPSYNSQGVPERGYKDICSILQRTLKDKAKHHHYSVDIKKIIVSGNLAVVHVVWKLSTMNAGMLEKANVTKEYSLDILEKQSDRRWRMTRFLAYKVPASAH